MNWESWAEPSGISWNDVPGFAAAAPLNLQRNLPAGNSTWLSKTLHSWMICACLHHKNHVDFNKLFNYQRL
jgi:hypothetical protein